MTLTIEQGYAPGCIGRITELHADFYGRLVGFGLPFEAKVAHGLVAFFEQYQARRDGIWLAVDGRKILGSIAIDGSRAEEEGAHLRWFIASEETRGTRIGSRLIERAMEHCIAQGFRRVYLWTFEGLEVARHLYERHGFRLVHQQAGDQWGKQVNEQRFEWKA
ncbi:GNAT family N-acetyltransferase [Pseudoxanthomonas sacheonensis]|uniref:GNAT superfamily N-acetyltransferase n=1 Tax=Pseudoxanthomonas sacheonensis TaxID=443615 RepID=A0ABU1RSH6_9GAMM|nr:GNAT family N-acetyltransferase [Pseudoxanthomonas sacheonensis]MDR6841727.1 GNAT superfamily N-acetyltransferase [Pseudoxanthomonas sacheonensis]